MRLEFGTYDINVSIKTSVSKSNRPAYNRWPWLQCWTQWKAIALLQISTGILMLGIIILTLSGRESSITVWQSVLLSLQAFGAPYMLSLHRQAVGQRVNRTQVHGSVTQ